MRSLLSTRDPDLATDSARVSRMTSLLGLSRRVGNGPAVSSYSLCFAFFVGFLPLPERSLLPGSLRHQFLRKPAVKVVLAITILSDCVLFSLSLR